MASIVCTCGKLVETQPEWSGQWITCPGCGGSLYAPFPGAKPSVPATASAETRLCPFCAETIPAADATCKFCGSDPRAPRPAHVRPAAPVPLPSASSKDDGLPVLILGLVGVMFCQLLCPIAWIIGATYEADCRRNGVAPSSSGHAGKIVGIVGTVFLGLGVIYGILSVVVQCL